MIALFRTVHLRSNSLLEPMNNSIPLCHSELAQFSHGWQQIKNQSLEVAANIKDLENCTKVMYWFSFLYTILNCNCFQDLRRKYWNNKIED